MQTKEARSAVHVPNRKTLLVLFASKSSQLQTSHNTREEHLQLHVAAHARWLARNVSSHAPRLRCSLLVPVYAGSAIKPPGRAPDAWNAYRAKSSTRSTFPHLTQTYTSSWCAKVVTRKATGITTLMTSVAGAAILEAELLLIKKA